MKISGERYPTHTNSVSDPHGSASILVGWTRIRIQEGEKDPQKYIKKLRNFIFWSDWCSLLRGEGFCCILDDIFGGLRKGYLNCNFSSKKPQTYLCGAVIFSPFLVIKTLDLNPNPHSRKMLDPDPHWNQRIWYTAHRHHNSSDRCIKSTWRD